MAYTSKANMQCIQIKQNKTIRRIVIAPWFVWNEDVNKDLKI